MFSKQDRRFKLRVFDLITGIHGLKILTKHI